MFIFTALLGMLVLLGGIILWPAVLVKKLLRREPRTLSRTAELLSCIGLGVTVASVALYGSGLSIGGKGIANCGESAGKAIQTEIDFAVEDGAEPVEIVLSTGFDSQIAWYHNVYDVSCNGLLLEETDATAQMCVETIENSTTIDAFYKPFFIQYVQRIAELYPEADLSILYKNLQTLQITELESHEYILKSWSTDSYGCYVMSENAIYIPAGTEYEEHTFGYQTLVHEFCHAARTCWFDEEEDDSIHCRLQFNSDYSNTLLMESMNSVFSCSLLDYYEWDIAYQVPSNYLRIMLECMDNYGLTDYLNHSEQYFLSKLDETAGYTNYAQVIWDLIALQRSDWSDEDIDIPAEEYNPIYEFLCELYFGKYMTEDMPEEERAALAEGLIYRAFYDAPEDYKTGEDFIREYAQTYVPAADFSE